MKIYIYIFNFRPFFEVFLSGHRNISDLCDLVCVRGHYSQLATDPSMKLRRLVYYLLGCTVEAPVKIFSKYSKFRPLLEVFPSGHRNISDLCDLVCVRGHYSKLATATSLKLHRLVY